jgi:hypothetical protein
VEECGPCPVFASFILAFALQPRKKHGKTSVRLRKTSVRVEKPQSEYSTHITKTSTHYKTHTLQNPHIHTHTHTQTHTRTHIHTYITKQYKTVTVQIKTNTVQDIPKLNSHNIIKCPQCKVIIFLHVFTTVLKCMHRLIRYRIFSTYT